MQPPISTTTNPLIRKVGIVLVLSPFANFLYSSYLQQHSLWQTAQSISVVNWVLWASALGAGLMMVRGQQKSWLFAFFLMAINVLYGVFTFKKAMLMGGWPMVGSAWFQPTASLAVNIGFLIYIYRLEFHGAAMVKVREVANDLSTSLSENLSEESPEKFSAPIPFPKVVHHQKEKFNVQLTKNVHIDFVGLGEWARIVEVSESGLVVRLLGEQAPEDIRHKNIEMILAPDMIVNLHCYDVIDDFYEFHFIQTSPEQLEQIKLWAAS